ncbi:MAG: hypothetical protein ACR2JO_11615 [Mycobacteriales bacterium]
MAVPARPSPASSRAQRVELAVYAFAAVSLIVLGVVFQTPVLNWIVGPAYIVSVVTLGTPLALKMARVDQQ